jgi:hypothetical protein
MSDHDKPVRTVRLPICNPLRSLGSVAHPSWAIPCYPVSRIKFAPADARRLCTFEHAQAAVTRDRLDPAPSPAPPAAVTTESRMGRARATVAASALSAVEAPYVAQRARRAGRMRHIATLTYRRSSFFAALWAVFCLPGKMRELKQDREMQERRIAAMTDDELAAEIELRLDGLGEGIAKDCRAIGASWPISAAPAYLTAARPDLTCRRLQPEGGRLRASRASKPA